MHVNDQMRPSAPREVMRKRNNIATSLAMQQAMTRSACTFDQLARVSDLGERAVRRWVAALHEAGGAHIERWVLNAAGRVVVPAFRFGAGEDAPRPGPARTPAERMAALRAKRAATMVSK
jgi:hypothetical protein